MPRWILKAHCIGADPGLFFPAPGEPLDPAMQLCTGCPVQADCLDFALTVEATTKLRDGVWGGTSPNERRRISAATH